MTPDDKVRLQRKLKAAVTRLVQAEVDHSWKGSLTDAEDRANVDRQLDLARGNYNKVLKEVFE